MKRIKTQEDVNKFNGIDNGIEDLDSDNTDLDNTDLDNTDSDNTNIKDIFQLSVFAERICFGINHKLCLQK
jgi:hypothetical protein